MQFIGPPRASGVREADGVREPNRVRVADHIIEALLAEAERAYPREACGILLGEGERIEAFEPAANVHPSPETHFEIDPQALIDAHRQARRGGPQVVGYYHSHPNGLAEPSATDRARSAGDGSIWAIIARGQATFWRDGESGFSPLSYSGANG